LAHNFIATEVLGHESRNKNTLSMPAFRWLKARDCCEVLAQSEFYCHTRGGVARRLFLKGWRIRPINPQPTFSVAKFLWP
jgi:hypothetical protein